MLLSPEEIKDGAEDRRLDWIRRCALQIHVINLDRRHDRWARIQEQARDNMGVSFVRQAAIDMPGHPWIACALGHQLAVFDAKLRGDPFVLVAEDDLRPTQWFGRLRELIRIGDEREFGAIYGGTVSYPDGIVGDPTSSIVETTTILSSHLTCYYARAYDAVLSWPLGWSSDYNVDPSVPSEHHERMRLLPPIPLKRGICVPFIATQISDWSDTCKRLVSLETHWRDAEEAWLRVARQAWEQRVI